MSFIDILIIAGLLSGASLGLRNGVIKQGVVLIGTLLCIVIAWALKTPLANFLSFNLPFFSFDGLTALNIVIYQLISFCLVLVILSFILVFVIKLSGGIEKILKFTIVLGIPSRILGLVLGLIEALVVIFICLFIINGTAINQKTNILDNSKFAPVILKSSPGLSNIAGNMNDTLTDISSITKAYSKDDKNKVNKEIIDTLLKHDVVTDDYLNKLNNKGKIKY